MQHTIASNYHLSALQTPTSGLLKLRHSLLLARSLLRRLYMTPHTRHVRVQGRLDARICHWSPRPHPDNSRGPPLWHHKGPTYQEDSILWTAMPAALFHCEEVRDQKLSHLLHCLQQLLGDSHEHITTFSLGVVPPIASSQCLYRFSFHLWSSAPRGTCLAYWPHHGCIPSNSGCSQPNTPAWAWSPQDRGSQAAVTCPAT